jgi:hypothetical protein
MPPRKSTSREKRKYEHIKKSAKKSGRSTKRAKQIAAATVMKQRPKGRKKTSGSRVPKSQKTMTRKQAARKGGKASARKRTGGRKKTSKR